MNIFEQATRKGIRFESSRGSLTVEDLWKLPLTHKRGDLNLDDLYIAHNKELKENDGESLVKAKTTNSNLSLKVDVLKHIIVTKMSEAEAAVQAKETKAQAEAIAEIIAKKENSQLEDLPIEELQKRLKALKQA